MQPRSTPLARALGAAALLSAGVAWGAAWLQYDSDTPRLDILVPLALAVVFAGGWLLASRSAPPVQPLSVAAPFRERIPGKLGAVRRDWGYVVAACLTIWAPFVAVCPVDDGDGDGDGAILRALYVLLTWLVGAVMSLYAVGLLKNQLGPAQRMLRQDAAAGRVHAVRVRFGTPVREAYRYPTGNGVGRIVTSSTYWIELVPESDSDGQRPIRLQAMSGHNFRISVGDKHLAQAAARLVGHSGWLYWPTRWQDVAGTNKERKVSASFVSDSGHVVWGQTGEPDYTPYLRAGAAPVCETDTALAAEPLPRPSRYVPRTHASHLGVAALGALLAVPYLLGAVPYWPALLLGVVAGGLGLYAGMGMSGAGVDEEPWSVRERSHPSLR